MDQCRWLSPDHHLVQLLGHAGTLWGLKRQNGENALLSCVQTQQASHAFERAVSGAYREMCTANTRTGNIRSGNMLALQFTKCIRHGDFFPLAFLEQTSGVTRTCLPGHACQSHHIQNVKDMIQT